MATEIRLQCDGSLAELILVPPEGRPVTLTHETLDLFDRQIAAIEALGERIRVVIVRSASPKYFCVGADLGSLQQLNQETIGPWVEHGHAVFDRLEKLPQPVIARVEGYALGGGLELALAADFIVASEQAQFGQTEARLGFITGWGAAWRLPRRIGAARAKELFFTGRIVPAVEAVQLGLVHACLPTAGLDSWCSKFVQDVSAGSSIAIREFKRLVSDNPTLTYEAKASGEVQSSVACLSSDDTQRRVKAFLESRKKPVSKG